MIKDIKKIEQYLKKLDKLGIQLDLDDIMGIVYETDDEIDFVVDGEMTIKREIAEFNLNEIVVVKLTDKGKKAYKKYETNLNLSNNLKKENLDGEIEFELWNLFKIFGEHMGIGNQVLFINNSFRMK